MYEQFQNGNMNSYIFCNITKKKKILFQIGHYIKQLFVKILNLTFFYIYIISMCVC